MPHTPLPPSLGGLQAVFRLASGLLGIWGGGWTQTGLLPRPASSSATVGARVAPWQALPYKQHISASKRRKEREKKAKLVGKQEQRVNTKSKQGPGQSVDCHIKGKEWALSTLFADSEIAPTTDI